jgi:hypothetical protein
MVADQNGDLLFEFFTKLTRVSSSKRKNTSELGRTLGNLMLGRFGHRIGKGSTKYRL